MTQTTSGYAHNCAIKSDGTVWCWGEGSNGELGNGTCTDSATPVQVSGLTGVGSISSEEPQCAVKNDGTVWCWGVAEVNGAADCSPVQIPGLTDVSTVRTTRNGYTSCVLKNDGTVWCWGRNDYGQFGDGTTDIWDHPTPEQTNITGVTEITMGGR